MNDTTYYQAVRSKEESKHLPFISDPAIPNDDALKKLSASLKWPLTLNVDYLLDKIIQRNEIIRHDENAGNHDAICPLDGPINMVVADIISPDWTWRHKCGRYWAVWPMSPLFMLIGATNGSVKLATGDGQQK